MFKKWFDFLLAVSGLLVSGWLILILLLLARIDTEGSGIFKQERIGQFGQPFQILKIRTMHPKSLKISRFGRILRSYKLDELPQLLNIIKGDMSFVGPRPDVPGYYDLLEGESRKILDLKPGLCSRAAIKYINEEDLLLSKEDPLRFNDEVIFPEKIKLNLEYYYKKSVQEDISILFQTLIKIILK